MHLVTVMHEADFVIPESPWAKGIGDYVVVVDKDRIALSQEESSIDFDGGRRRPIVIFDSILFEHKLLSQPDRSLLVGKQYCSPDAETREGEGSGFRCSKSIALIHADQLKDKHDLSYWSSLRPILGKLTELEKVIASRAIQLQKWRHEHRYCGICGAETRHSSDDMAMVCPACSHRMYARISPCVIGIITKGRQVLLARGHKHRQGMFSAVAGFIESGESAEEAFAREVREEVGIGIKNVRYRLSQPWPFPGQLMLGFTAEYDAGEICIEPKEIAEAHWFSIDELPDTSPPYTIAGQLIDIAAADMHYGSASS